MYSENINQYVSFKSEELSQNINVRLYKYLFPSVSC